MSEQPASRYNAVKHGITSAHLILVNEEREAYNLQLEAIRRQYAPANDAEASLVQRIADHRWQIHRACLAQINVSGCLGALEFSPDDVVPAEHLDQLAKVGRTLNNYMLYETRLRNRIAEEQAELEALQTARQASGKELPEAAAPSKAVKAGPVAVPPQVTKREDGFVFSAPAKPQSETEPPRHQTSA